MKIAICILAFLTYVTGFSQVVADPFLCPCSKIGLDSIWANENKISCYLIPVEKNSKIPSKEKIVLAVAVAESTPKTSSQPLLYLHGGPGIATLGNLPNYIKSPTWSLLRQKHDLIFFDYRATGFSEPKLCDDISDSLGAYSKERISQSIQEYAVSLYKNCRDTLLKQGVDLSAFSSYQLAADAEAIRKSLKIDEWSVYGVSFGTTVAMNLLRSFPGAIQSVILDSPFPPNSPWSDFVRPFDTCFKILEKNLAADPVTNRKFLSLRKDFAVAVDRLNRNPVLVKMKSGPGNMDYPYTGDDFAWSIWSAMLKPKAIPLVPMTILEVANGNDSLLQSWATLFSSSDSYGKFSQTQSHAILCYEGRPQKAEDTEDSLRKRYPEFASFNSGFPTAICNVWRPDVPDRKIFEPVASNKKVLILSGEYDPVCPPFFGEIARKTLPNSTLLIVPSASHAVVHFSDCTRKVVNSFLSSTGKQAAIRCISDVPPVKFVTESIDEAMRCYQKK